MSPGVTFKRRPLIAAVILLIVGVGLSYNSVGKGTPVKPMELKVV